MNITRKILEDAAVGVGVADRPEDLDVIHKPGVAAALWRRQPLPGFQDWIDTLSPVVLPQVRVILRPEAVHTTVTEVCDAAGTPAGPSAHAADRRHHGTDRDLCGADAGAVSAPAARRDRA